MKELAQKIGKLKAVIWHSNRVEQIHIILCTEGTVLFYPRCCRRLRALATWQCSAVFRWVHGDVVACADGLGEFRKN